MNKIKVLIAAILLFSFSVASCENRSESAGPQLLTECNFESPITLSVVEYNTQEELIDYWSKISQNPIPSDSLFEGFSTLNTRTNQYTLHILRIRGQDDSRRMEVLGHELMHGFCGDFHSKVISY